MKLWLINGLQGVAYVLARWFKWHLRPEFFMWVKFYDFSVLIWFLSVFFVIKLFQLDLHSLCKLTSSAKILDVKKVILSLYHKGLPCLQIGSKKSIAKVAKPVFEFVPHFEINTWNAGHFASFLLKYFINTSKTNLWNYPYCINNLIGECQTESEFLQVWGSTQCNIDFSEKVFCFSNYENIINLCL